MYQKFLSDLVRYFVTSSPLAMRKSAKEQQSQVQAIQRSVMVLAGP